MTEPERGAVRPAMTPEEWAREAFHDAETSYGAFLATDRSWVGISGADHNCEWLTRLHALAALCLHGQPFGFTREDVTELRKEAERSEYADRTGDNSGYSMMYPGHMRDLADRIEALLPPAGEAMSEDPLA